MKKEEYKQIGKLNDFQESCMWMSYRYCIGRHSIAAHHHAGDIAKYCYGKLDFDRSWFVAFDINREVQGCMERMGVWKFPIRNTFAVTGIDAFCEFVNKEGIASDDDYKKYKRIEVDYKESSNTYTFKTVLWDDYIKDELEFLFKDRDEALKSYLDWEKDLFKCDDAKIIERFDSIRRERHYNSLSGNYYDDLFIWNNLVHLFDIECHHKSILVNDKEEEWYWSWRKIGEFKYEKIRIPVCEGCSENFILPESSIKQDIE